MRIINKISLLKLILAIVCIPSLAFGEWNIDKAANEFPKNLKGEVYGEQFVFGEAVWSKNGVLSINSKQLRKNGSPERQFVIFIGRAEPPHVWSFNQDSRPHSAPHIHMKFTKDDDVLGALTFTSEYLIYLKLESLDDNTAQFKIHLSLPDYKKSYLLGTFEADVEK